MNDILRNFIKNSKNFIAEAIELDKMEPDKDYYELLLNDLLIKGYTSYENFMRELFGYLFKLINQDEKYHPIFLNNKFNLDTHNFFVPPVKYTDIKKHFPLIEKWLDDIEKFKEIGKLIDTLVDGRNSYAHQGKNKITFEQILSSYLAVQALVRFLNFYYIYSKEDYKENKDYIVSEGKVFKKIKGLKIAFDGLKKGHKNFENIEIEHGNNIKNQVETFKKTINEFDEERNIKVIINSYFDNFQKGAKNFLLESEEVTIENSSLFFEVLENAYKYYFFGIEIPQKNIKKSTADINSIKITISIMEKYK